MLIRPAEFTHASEKFEFTTKEFRASGAGRSLRGPYQSMEWIELKRSSPVQIHEPLILIQSNPADEPESESSPVQSGHNRVGIYQMPCKIVM